MLTWLSVRQKEKGQRLRVAQKAASFPISSPIPVRKSEIKKPILAQKVEVEKPKIVLAYVQVHSKPEIWKTHQTRNMSKKPSSC